LLDCLRTQVTVAAVGAGMNQGGDAGPLCAAGGIAALLGGIYNSGILADPRPDRAFGTPSPSDAR
jgi:hypothetical protein